VITGIVLAAGEGIRFGGAKVVAALHGTPVVRHVVDRLREAGVDDVVVVAGDALQEVTQACAGSGARIVRNPHPDLGLSGSLRLGVEAARAADALVVALGDQPTIASTVVGDLMRAWEGSNAAAVVPVYADGRGNPVLFDGTLRAELSVLTGDAGARELLTRLGDRLLWVDVPGRAPRDIDTTDDLKALESEPG
jgi:molybdenum cofactor cytidylyltransferase